MFGGAFSERVFANPKADEKIPDQILARGFYLVDENNKPRAGISFDRSGQPAVYVLDKVGQMRGYLACEDSGPALALNDKKGNMSVGMRTGDRGDSIIALMAEKRQDATGVWITNPGEDRCHRAYSTRKTPLGRAFNGQLFKANRQSVSIKLEWHTGYYHVLRPQKGSGLYWDLWNSHNASQRWAIGLHERQAPPCSPTTLTTPACCSTPSATAARPWACSARVAWCGPPPGPHPRCPPWTAS